MPASLDPAAYLAAIRREGDAFAAAAAAGLERAVPSCPVWTVRDLVTHLGRVFYNREELVRRRMQEYPRTPRPGEDVDLLAWYRDGLDSVLAALAAADPADQVVTFHPPDHTVGFWYRRMAHEAAIHRIDAELAGGPPGPIEEQLAADGIDEVLEVFLAGCGEGVSASPGPARLLIESDGRSWLVRFVDCAGRLGRDEAKEWETIVLESHGVADAHLSGPPSDVDRFIWGRGGLDRLTVEGDVGLVHRLRAVAALST